MGGTTIITIWANSTCLATSTLRQERYITYATAAGHARAPATVADIMAYDIATPIKKRVFTPRMPRQRSAPQNF